MDLRNSTGRPVRPQQTQQPQQSTPTTPPPVGRQAYQQPRRKKWWLLVGLPLVLIVVAALAWHLQSGSASPRGDRYQAVFLDNGQVFFGKLKNTDGRYLKLEGAYYTKKQDLPADATEEQKAAVNNNVSLVKVGDEVYGPESTIQVRAEQVLFWQDLTSDSKVAKAIDDAKE